MEYGFIELAEPIFIIAIFSFLYKRSKNNVSTIETDALSYLSTVICCIWIVFAIFVQMRVILLAFEGSNLSTLGLSPLNISIAFNPIFIFVAVALLLPLAHLLHAYWSKKRTIFKRFNLFESGWGGNDYELLTSWISKYSDILQLKSKPKVLFSKYENFSPVVFINRPTDSYMIFPINFIAMTCKFTSIGSIEQRHSLAEFVVLHELAHLTNKDYYAVNMLGSVTRAIFFYTAILAFFTILCLVWGDTNNGVPKLFFFTYFIVTLPIGLYMYFSNKAIEADREALADARAAGIFDSDKFQLITEKVGGETNKKAMLYRYFQLAGMGSINLGKGQTKIYSIVSKVHDLFGNSMDNLLKMIKRCGGSTEEGIDELEDRIEKLSSGKLVFAKNLFLDKNKLMWIGSIFGLIIFVFLFIAAGISKSYEQYNLPEIPINKIFFQLPAQLCSIVMAFIFCMPIFNSRFDFTDIPNYLKQFVAKIRYPFLLFIIVTVFFYTIIFLLAYFSDKNVDAMVGGFVYFLYLFIRFSFMSLVFALLMMSIFGIISEFDRKTIELVIIGALTVLLCSAIFLYYSNALQSEYYPIIFALSVCIWIALLSSLVKDKLNSIVGDNIVIFEYGNKSITIDLAKKTGLAKHSILFIVALVISIVILFVPVCILILIMQNGVVQESHISAVMHIIIILICSVAAVLIYLFVNKVSGYTPSTFEDEIMKYEIYDLFQLEYPRDHLNKQLRNLLSAFCFDDESNHSKSNLVMRKNWPLEIYFNLVKLHNKIDLGLSANSFESILHYECAEGGFSHVPGAYPSVRSSYHGLFILANFKKLNMVDITRHIKWISGKIDDHIDNVHELAIDDIDTMSYYIKILRLLSLPIPETIKQFMEKTNFPLSCSSKDMHELISCFYVAKRRIPIRLIDKIRFWLALERNRIFELRVDNHIKYHFYYFSILKKLKMEDRELREITMANILKSSIIKD